MGMLFSGTPKPPSVPMPPPAAHPPTMASTTAFSQSAAKQGSRAAAANDTLKTSPQGLEAPATNKTLLGQ